jgi:NDP-sugar pyrophosphorylase family protein
MKETIAGFVSTPPDAVLAKRVENPGRYGVLTLSGNLVKSIAEKPREAKSNIVSTGIYALNRDFYDFIGDNLDIPDVISVMMGNSRSFKAIETDGTWLDAVYPWDLISMSDAVLSRLRNTLAGTIEGNAAMIPPVSIGTGTVIHSGSYLSGPVVIGSNCEIGPSTVIIGATSVGDNTIISPFCHIKNCVIGSDVTIGTGCIIEDSVIDKGTEIKARFTAMKGVADVKVDDEHHEVNIGAMVGEDCIIEAGVVAEAGVVVGNLSRIRPLKVISGRLPDKSIVM